MSGIAGEGLERSFTTFIEVKAATVGLAVGPDKEERCLAYLECDRYCKLGKNEVGGV